MWECLHYLPLLNFFLSFIILLSCYFMNSKHSLKFPSFNLLPPNAYYFFHYNSTYGNPSFCDDSNDSIFCIKCTSWYLKKDIYEIHFSCHKVPWRTVIVFNDTAFLACNKQVFLSSVVGCTALIFLSLSVTFL